MTWHVTPEFVVSSLRFLLDSYKLARDRFKDKKAPEELEKIVIKAERSEPKTLDAAEIERDLTESLTPEDAAIVKGDLELLSLLVMPAPRLEAFDYWGMLSRLVEGLREFARKNRLFELRGKEEYSFGQVLLLPKTGDHILPKKHAAKLPRPYERQGVKDADCLAFLRKGGSAFPLHVLVDARFYRYDGMGGPPPVESDSCFFDVEPGQQRHWLKFDRGHRISGHFVQDFEYMLEASDLVSIVQGLRDDIRDYATAINLDEKRILPVFDAIDAFVRGEAAGGSDQGF
jgi:hypothetical protein